MIKFRTTISILAMPFIVLLLSCDKKTDSSSNSASEADPASASSDTPGPLAEAKKDPKLNQVIDVMRRKQAAGLGSGTVTVNGAWAYTGYSYLEAVPEARLIAVDVTVSGHTADFDFDDIEIIDGASRISYGSDPHITLLTEEGKPVLDARQLPPAPDPVRILLIYGFPKNTPEFTLYYWGRNLLRQNHPIKERGWELPFPKKEAK